MGDVVNEDAYISLTDIAKYKNPDNAFIVVANWMRNHSTISFLGLWEQIHNVNYKPIEFDRFKAESGDNAFTLTPQQWMHACFRMYKKPPAKFNFAGGLLIRTYQADLEHIKNLLNLNAF